MTLVRFVTVVAVAVCALALHAAGARAQSALEQAVAAVDTVTTSDSTTVDSTAANVYVPPERVAPTYSSSYGLNRTETTWRQGLSFTLPWRRFTLTHSTNGNLRSDTSRNQRDNRDISSRTTLDYAAGRAFHVGLEYDLPKTTLSDFTSKNGTDRSDLAVTASYNTTLTPRLTLDLSGSGGRATESYISRRYATSRDPNSPDQSDDSDASGVRGSGSASVGYTPINWLSVKSKWDRSRSHRDSRSRTTFAVQDSAQGDTNRVEVVTNIDNTNNKSATLSFVPNFFLTGTLDLSDKNEQAQYFAPNTRSGGGQETRTTLGRTAVLRTKAHAGTKLESNWSVTLGENTTRYAQGSNRSRRVGTLRIDADLRWKLWGTDISSQFSSDSTRTEYLDTGSTETSTGETGNVYTRSMRVDLARALTQKTSLKMAGSVSLIRYEFDDSKQDRDVGNQRAQLTLSRTLSRKASLSVDFSAENKDRISVHRSQSKSSNSEQVYTMSPSLSYDVTPRVKVTQGYQIQSDYTVYRFDETRNFYTGTWSVNNKITTQISKRVKLDVTHYQLLRESGKYRRTAPDQPRLFFKGGENRTNDLTMLVSYNLSQRITLSTSQRLNIATGYALSGGVLTRQSEQRRLDLNGTTSLSYFLRDGTQVQVNVRRVSSTSDLENYWTVNADLKKTFFK